MRTLLIIILTVLSTFIFAQKIERNLLTSRCSVESLETLLLEPKEWVYYPKDARQWQKIVPENIYSNQIEAGVELLGKEWPILKATTFLEYTRTGNRSNYEAALFESEFILKRTEKFMNLIICRILKY